MVLWALKGADFGEVRELNGPRVHSCAVSGLVPPSVLVETMSSLTDQMQMGWPFIKSSKSWLELEVGG